MCTGFKRYKIEINEDAPLHKVIFQLELMGYQQWGVPSETISLIRTVEKYGQKRFEFTNQHPNAFPEWKLIKLKHLKSMNRKLL